SVLPVAPPGRGLTAGQRRKRSVGRALAENGYVEVLSYPFTSASVLDALQVPEGDPRRTVVRLTNPLSDEEPLLRTTLLPPLLGTLRRNLGRGMRDLALYEVGPVFRATGATGTPPVMGVDGRPDEADLVAAERFVPQQPWHVAAVLAADVEAALVSGAGELLESVRLFDVYTSEQLGAGRRSLAYKLTFRAPDRTLTVEEAVAARDAAVAVAAECYGAMLRGA